VQEERGYEEKITKTKVNPKSYALFSFFSRIIDNDPIGCIREKN